MSSYPVLVARNLSYDVTGDELYELFGKYGAVQQIRLGDNDDTKGSAYVVYEDLKDARIAKQKLEGFNFKGRYIVVSFFSTTGGDNEMEERKKRLDELKRAHNIE